MESNIGCALLDWILFEARNRVLDTAPGNPEMLQRLASDDLACASSISVCPGILGLFPFPRLIDQRPIVFRIRAQNQSRTGPIPRAESLSSCVLCLVSRRSLFAAFRPFFEVETNRRSSNSPYASSSPPMSRTDPGPCSLRWIAASGFSCHDSGLAGKRRWSSSNLTQWLAGTERDSVSTGDPFPSGVPGDLPFPRRCRH